jgi:small subunit ribosomal protein S17e
LGKVRPEYVKKIARELLGLYPNKFTQDFQKNKTAIDSLAKVQSSKLRNRIAGYITRLMATDVEEIPEDEEETEEIVEEEE